MPATDFWTSAFAEFGVRAAARLAAGPRAHDIYDRKIMLPRVIPVMPAELEDSGEDTARRIIQRIARALRGERARGRGGHWAYDLNRHVALIRAYKAERRRLNELAGAGHR